MIRVPKDSIADYQERLNHYSKDSLVENQAIFDAQVAKINARNGDVPDYEYVELAAAAEAISILGGASDPENKLNEGARAKYDSFEIAPEVALTEKRFAKDPRLAELEKLGIKPATIRGLSGVKTTGLRDGMQIPKPKGEGSSRGR